MRLGKDGYQSRNARAPWRRTGLVDGGAGGRAVTCMVVGTGPPYLGRLVRPNEDRRHNFRGL